MANGNLYLALCLTVLIGIGVPGFLYLGLRRGGHIQQVDMMRDAMRRANKPWEGEDKDLAELAKQVEKLREPRDPSD